MVDALNSAKAAEVFKQTMEGPITRRAECFITGIDLQQEGIHETEDGFNVVVDRGVAFGPGPCASKAIEGPRARVYKGDSFRAEVVLPDDYQQLDGDSIGFFKVIDPENPDKYMSVTRFSVTEVIVESQGISLIPLR
jgi:hypothetical protein